MSEPEVRPEYPHSILERSGERGASDLSFMVSWCSTPARRGPCIIWASDPQPGPCAFRFFLVLFPSFQRVGYLRFALICQYSSAHIAHEEEEKGVQQLFRMLHAQVVIPIEGKDEFIRS